MAEFLNENKFIRLSLVLITTLLIGLIIVSVVNKAKSGSSDRPDARGVRRVTGEIDIRNAFIKVADAVGPAVVSISTERTQKIKVNPFPFRREGSPFQDEFFNKFFDDFFNNSFPQEYERKQAGLGSGVIIDKRGYILTNEHVVSGADKIMVTLPDGRKFEGQVKGSDVKSDLAIIEIEAKSLPVAELGNSDLAQIGEWVVAIGNPFGYIVHSPKPTVTVGVISALQRSLPSAKSRYLDLIQTDAAINPGNSGGPLCDLEGKVIGINVAIFSTSGGYQGVGFAIPANSAKAVVEELIKGGKVSYGWMGVVIQDLTEDLAKYFAISDEKGALVAEVVEDGPADRGGLKKGDVIKGINGKEIKGVQDIMVNVSRIPIGKEAELSIIRNKEDVTLTIIIGEMPSEEELAKIEGRPIEEKQDQPAIEKWRGMIVSPITDNIAARFGLTDTEGVIIASVDQGSAAYQAGLKPGNIITSIDTKRIKTIDDYKVAIENAKGDILVYTNKGFTIVKEPK